MKVVPLHSARLKAAKRASRPMTIAQAAAAKDKPTKPYEVRAESPQGLLLRVQPSGTRTYYVQLKRGKRIRLGAADVWLLAQAKDKAKKLLLYPEAALATRRAGTTLAEYIDNEYTEHALARLKNGAKSIARVKAMWKSLLAKRIAEITGADVDRLRNKRLNSGISPATVNRDMAALSGVFAHWVDNNKGKLHPLASLGVLKVADDETVRYLTGAEAAHLRQALADRDERMAKARRTANAWRAARRYDRLPELANYADHITPMVLLSLNTGLRQGELFSLEWESVDLERKTITVLASHSKGNTTRVVPLNAEALAVLAAIKPRSAAGLVFESPVSGGRFDNVKRAWAEITKAAGLPDLRWHDLRHDFASQLVMRGVPLFTVQKLLGHANPRMTQRYAKLAPDTLADAVAKLGAA